MKKLLTIGGIVIVIFALIIFLTNKSNDDKLVDNPYGTNKLDQQTINLLDDENYNNIILPKELEEKMAAGDEMTVYFFRPDCQYCIQMTPRLMPIADELDKEVLQYNLLEFNEFAAPYQIVSTPTLVHYKDGEEIVRMEGLHPEENIRLFFNEYTQSDE